MYCLKILFTFLNSVDPDEMQHIAAFHLNLHCLQKYSFRGFPEYKRLTVFKLIDYSIHVNTIGME